nr:hypothetical protein [Anaerolineae bacterium]
DQQQYVFNLDESRIFLDAIPNGAILVDRGSDYQLARRYMATDEGIYIWRPDEGETLLIDGAVNIPKR